MGPSRQQTCFRVQPEGSTAAPGSSRSQNAKIIASELNASRTAQCPSARQLRAVLLLARAASRPLRPGTQNEQFQGLGDTRSQRREKSRNVNVRRFHALLVLAVNCGLLHCRRRPELLFRGFQSFMVSVCASRMQQIDGTLQL